MRPFFYSYRMINLLKYALGGLFFLLHFYVDAQPLFELSRNVYRIPYENAKQMEVRQDHYTHSPAQGRYDLRALGTDDCNSHKIVAAAEGRVEMVVENNTQSCPTCGSSNNYVWISHANDEWTKYTHFKQNSVTVNVGDIVCAGTVLGDECWVGATNPAEFRHLHWEVRRPNNPASPVINPSGGFMNNGDGAHLIPVINSFSKHYFEQNDAWTASSSTSCTHTNISMGSQTIAVNDIKIYMASTDIITNNNAVVFQNGSNGMFHAGNSVTLSPGFTAGAGSYFHAKIGSCATTNFPGACQ